ncbi:hypothetical protein M23134_07457 [Microscilla marina ATCC 23134]|uniref:Uncharacterized protein n=1 Tax=Microscilla marina ATCC 23134 TaxID=313606 RepID=A1ZEU8_MICM2|nr:hypothetical protein M23134_07457 [Microscilla marina ATCC 23134]
MSFDLNNACIRSVYDWLITAHTIFLDKKTVRKKIAQWQLYFVIK